MKPAPFEYLAPNKLSEAVSLLSELGEEASIMAGGQSLVPAMTVRLASPDTIIDLNNIKELKNINIDDQNIRIGALVTHSDVESSDQLRSVLPILSTIAKHIAHPSIRNRGTFGGSLAHADPAAEWPCVLLGMNGSIKANSVRGERTIKAKDFFQSLFSTTLETDEILTEAIIPLSATRSSWVFQEVSKQVGAFGIVFVLVGVLKNQSGLVEDVCAVLGGCGEVPLIPSVNQTIIVGKIPTINLVEQYTAEIIRSLDPPSDINATKGNKIQMARTLLMRALTEALSL
jgi:CO/xanthine dehydrogenase FAD-binding subunit|tara:strand:- start:4099 stop:4959 length:861 start_codon:yes stop_codon:yes gene_type:complete